MTTTAASFHRLFGALLLAGAAVLGAGQAKAATKCAPVGDGMERCVSGLSAGQITQVYEQQERTNWCWAASIRMVLRSHGVEVTQEQVVRRHLGEAKDVAISGAAISGLLAGTWKDADGYDVAVAALPLPSWRRHYGLAAPEVLADLDQERPLILGANEHAMVLVQLVFDRPIGRPGTIRIARAVVLDPQRSPGVRSLTANELQPEFVARVNVDGGTEQVAKLQQRRAVANAANSAVATITR
jgi:hypothetical protein